MIWNQPQIMFPRVSLKIVLLMAKLLKASRTWLCPYLWAYGNCSSFPMHLCGQGFFLSSVFNFRSMETTLVRFTLLNNSLRRTCSRIFTWRGVPFEKCTLRFGSKNCVLFPKIDLDFGGSISRNTQANCFEFFNKATDPFLPLFFCLLLGWLSTSVCLNTHFTPNLQCWHTGGCQQSHVGFVQFPLK